MLLLLIAVIMKTNLSPSVHLDPEDQEHQVSLGDPKVENSKYTDNDKTTIMIHTKANVRKNTIV